MSEMSHTPETPGTAEFPVTHDARQSRFVVEHDGETAVAEYRRRGDEVHFTHTLVPPSLEGQGVGSALARAGLDWAVAEGLVIVPHCHFIADYVRRNDAYRPHVAEGWR